MNKEKVIPMFGFKDNTEGFSQVTEGNIMKKDHEEVTMKDLQHLEEKTNLKLENLESKISHEINILDTKIESRLDKMEINLANRLEKMIHEQQENTRKARNSLLAWLIPTIITTVGVAFTILGYLGK